MTSSVANPTDPVSDNGGGSSYDPSLPTNNPAQPNQSGWVDEMDSATWPAGVWDQQGVSAAPTFVSDGVTAYRFVLSSGQRVEISSLLSPTRLDAVGSLVRMLARVMADPAQELVMGMTNVQGDTLGTPPTDGVWIARDAGGVCRLNLASGGVVTSAALAFPLPPRGYFDVSMQALPKDGGGLEATAWVAGLPAAILSGPAPVGWLYPRVGAKGAGALALDRLGRSSVGLSTGELL